MKRAFWVSITLGLMAYVLLPLPGGAKPLKERIQEKRAQVEGVKRREGVLTTTISSFNSRIEALQGQIAATQHQLGVVQRDLDAKRAELIEVADRLVEIYKSDAPDALTVVLQADGFADLLERTEYLDRISDQDRTTVDRVRILKAQVQRQTERLATLERQAQLAAEAILHRRDQIAGARDQLVASRSDLREARNERAAALRSVRSRHAQVQEDLDALEAEQARVQATLQGASGGAAAPIRSGSGQLIWPVNGPITGVFGEARPGHMHAGVDISAPTGTPIRAADSGRVALMGWVGGYGNYTCIQHTSSMSTCYGHQSRFGTSNGAAVQQGQTIGYVGSTGNSTGSHVHFEVRIGGSPVDPMGYL